nr:hypothetical protein CFP56_36356 [Quercus suber]
MVCSVSVSLAQGMPRRRAEKPDRSELPMTDDDLRRSSETCTTVDQNIVDSIDLPSGCLDNLEIMMPC